MRLYLFMWICVNLERQILVMEFLTSVLFPVLLIGGMGLIFGIGLGTFGEIFNVEEDPRVAEIREVLPGANCAGCGYAGCDSFAAAVASNETSIVGCPVGGPACADRIADIMGIAHQAMRRHTAFVKCVGTCDKAAENYKYTGLDDCKAINQLSGNGPKTCVYGCLGNGNCYRACAFGAIILEDGIARVNSDKCTACGKCVASCPRQLIELVPADKPVRVACNSLDVGKVVRSYCSAGCISCKICEKACAYDAIHIGVNLAKVDYDKCTLCDACVTKCPTKVIKH